MKRVLVCVSWLPALKIHYIFKFSLAKTLLQFVGVSLPLKVPVTTSFVNSKGSHEITMKTKVGIIIKCLIFSICAYFFGKSAYKAWLVFDSGLSTNTNTIEPVSELGLLLPNLLICNQTGFKNKIINTNKEDFHREFIKKFYSTKPRNSIYQKCKT